ncbi:MAG TPA: CHRD domain-containing protein [Gaiellaceae bacterium]|nr:CHRD domain-containing protein [Gaiellaceae bacterium]
MKGLVIVVVAGALVVTAGAGARSQATKIQIAAAMAASAETPAPKGDVGNARGTFAGALTKSDSGAVLTWQLSFSGLTGDAVAAHIHIADRGKPGPVVVPLCAPCTSGVTGTSNINATVLEAIENDRAYVNVHTRTNPAGEIRDQISIVASLRTTLRAAQERPKPRGNTRRARGAFTVSITKQGSSAVLVWRLTFSRLTGKAVAAHIHSGARGKPGPVIVPLCAPCRSGARGRATVDASVLDALESGRTYVNVHTKRNPAGEIRGQLGAAALTIS